MTRPSRFCTADRSFRYSRRRGLPTLGTECSLHLGRSMRETERGEIEKFMLGLERRNPGEPEFHQAVREVMETLVPFTFEHPRYRTAQILERLTEPDRVI